MVLNIIFIALITQLGLVQRMFWFWRWYKWDCVSRFLPVVPYTGPLLHPNAHLCGQHTLDTPLHRTAVHTISLQKNLLHPLPHLSPALRGPAPIILLWSIRWHRPRGPDFALLQIFTIFTLCFLLDAVSLIPGKARLIDSATGCTQLQQSISHKTELLEGR